MNWQKENTQLQTYVPIVLKGGFKTLAKQTKKSVSFHMRQAMTDYLSKHGITTNSNK